MTSNSKTSKKDESNIITLSALKEIIVLVNEEISVFNIGITDNNSIFMRVKNKNESIYEGLFSFLEVKQNTLNSTDNLKLIFDWYISRFSYNQDVFKYNEDNTKLYFCFNIFNRNTGAIEEKTLILTLKSNPNDLLVVNNEDKIQLLNEFNRQYKTFLTKNEENISLTNKSMNNKGFKDLCELDLDI